MKIAVIAPTELPARRANTIQVMKMAQALVGLGHEIRVASPSSSAVHPDWDELARHYGLEKSFPVEWLPAAPRWRRYDYGLRSVRWAKHWGADLIFTRLPQTAAIASLQGRATILEVHDLPVGIAGPLLLRTFLLGRGRRGLLTITRALAEDLARFGAPPVGGFTRVAPDGVDLERYANLPAPEGARLQLPIHLEGFTAGYTGHLYAGRGAELLVELAYHLPGIQFLLVGGEPGDVDRLRQLAQQRGLANLHLVGFVPNADLPLYQAACDVLLMPYQKRVAASSGGDIARYLSPMKLFEYLACGRPILCSNLSVLGEVLNDQNAVLLPPDEVPAWVGALLKLQADPLLRSTLGERARQNAAQYTWERRARIMLQGVAHG